VPQRLGGIERIDETVLARGARHELGDALRPLLADGVRIEAAFLPDHPGKELDRKSILRRRLFQRAANVVGGRRLGGCGVWRTARGSLPASATIRRRRGGACLRMGVRIGESERANNKRSGQARHSWSSLLRKAKRRD
jgi:hypothetical protein